MVWGGFSVAEQRRGDGEVTGAQGGTAALELGLGVLRARAAGGAVLRGRRGEQGEGPVARSGKWPVGAAQVGWAA